jgi:hypothetical protein
VTYIVQRFTSLAILFYLLSLVMYIKWRLGRQKAETASQDCILVCGIPRVCGPRHEDQGDRVYSPAHHCPL